MYLRPELPNLKQNRSQLKGDVGAESVWLFDRIKTQRQAFFASTYYYNADHFLTQLCHVIPPWFVVNNNLEAFYMIRVKECEYLRMVDFRLKGVGVKAAAKRFRTHITNQ